MELEKFLAMTLQAMAAFFRNDNGILSKMWDKIYKMVNEKLNSTCTFVKYHENIVGIDKR